MRRLTVLSLSPELVFPGLTVDHLNDRVMVMPTNYCVGQMYSAK